MQVLICYSRIASNFKLHFIFIGRRNTGYVEQWDSLVPELKVEEMISYSADLLLSSQFSKTERQARVEETIIQLRLQVPKY